MSSAPIGRSHRDLAIVADSWTRLPERPDAAVGIMMRMLYTS